MKIAYYCQHVLGIGHFHRSLAICQELAKDHHITLITGGPNVEVTRSDINIFKLPGLQMDHDFKHLRPTDSNNTLNEVKGKRILLLENFLMKYKPEIFMVELYPFGRKAFRFELDPVLSKIQKGVIPSCLSICSLRDILVERQDKVKFEQRIVTTFNQLFDGLLIHADQSVTQIDTTFSRTKDLRHPIHYTGFITPKPSEAGRANIRKSLGLTSRHRLVVASIGGGNVGSELLLATAKTFQLLNNDTFFLQIFTGPYLDPDLYAQLLQMKEPHLQIERFTDNFVEWLAAADLSISMAGYNTTMNLLASGTPALIYPFSQNHEQHLRIENINSNGQFQILDRKDLKPSRLMSFMERHAENNRFTSPVDLDGATNTSNTITLWNKYKYKEL